MITFTGFDFSSFHYILQSFQPLYEDYTPYTDNGGIYKIDLVNKNKGRPRTMTATTCLGLVLAWGRTRGSEMVLCLIFCITGSVCSLFIRFGRRLLLKALARDPKAAVKMPGYEEVEEFKMAIYIKYSLLSDVYCVVDGLKMALEQSGDCVRYKICSTPDGSTATTSEVLLFSFQVVSL